MRDVLPLRQVADLQHGAGAQARLVAGRGGGGVLALVRLEAADHLFALRLAEGVAVHADEVRLLHLCATLGACRRPRLRAETTHLHPAVFHRHRSPLSCETATIAEQGALPQILGEGWKIRPPNPPAPDAPRSPRWSAPGSRCAGHRPWRACRAASRPGGPSTRTARRPA